MTVRLLLALACVGVAATAAGAQERALAFPAALSSPARDTLTRLADSTRALGIPLEPIVAKASEGVLKGATEARIIAAVRALVDQLIEARRIVPASATTGTLTAAASALRAGVSPALLRDLAAAAGDGSDADLGVALVTVADLATNGVSPATAGRSVEQLLRRGAPERDFAALRAAVAQDVQTGVAPERALADRMRTLFGGRSTASPPAR